MGDGERERSCPRAVFPLEPSLWRPRCTLKARIGIGSTSTASWKPDVVVVVVVLVVVTIGEVGPMVGLPMVKTGSGSAS